MAHLHRDAAKWQLYEVDTREDVVKEIDVCDRGNVRTRLVHCADEDAVRERFAPAIATSPGIDVGGRSGGDFARERSRFVFTGWNSRAPVRSTIRSLRSGAEIVFGLGAAERVLGKENAAAFRNIVCSIGEVRHAEGPRDHRLWRMHPERWLESLVVRDVAGVDERLDSGPRVFAGAGIFGVGPRHDRRA